LDVVKYLFEGFGLTADDARACKNKKLNCCISYGYLGVAKYLIEVVGLTANDAREALDGEVFRSASVMQYLKVEVLKDPAACLFHGIKARLKSKVQQ
jgi:hypothetical protein